MWYVIVILAIIVLVAVSVGRCKYKERVRSTVAIYRGIDIMHSDRAYFELSSGENESFGLSYVLSEKDEGKYGILEYNNISYSFKVFENQDEGKQLFEAETKCDKLAHRISNKKWEFFIKYVWYIYDIICLAFILYRYFSASDLLDNTIVIGIIAMVPIRLLVWMKCEIEFKWYTLWLLGDAIVGAICFFILSKLFGTMMVVVALIMWLSLIVVSFIRSLFY